MNDPQKKDRFLTYHQVCDRLAISKSSFYRLAGEGKFGPIYRIGKAGIRVRESGIEAFIANAEDEDY